MPEAVPEALRRVAVRVNDDALRWVRAGHPWVFADSIVSEADGGRMGDLAVVFDRKRRFQAIGLYDPGSPIRVRVLHRGAPVPIDAAWWDERVATVVERRRSYLEDPSTTGVRFINGENDGLGGLVVDGYDHVAVVKLYTPAWFAYLDQVLPVLCRTLPVDTVVLRLSRRTAREAPDGVADGTALVGNLPKHPVRFRENGLDVEADVVTGQKTGYFLDQRDNRRLVGAQCARARVLDVFCAGGGFTLAAAAGGAASMCSVDIASPALEATMRNLAHNRALANVRNCRHTTRLGDAFEVMADLAAERRHFDVVIVDPPSFAHDAAGVSRALRAYARLTELAVPLVAEGGLFVQASCSSRVSADDFFATVTSAIHRAGADSIEVRRTGHPRDHQVGFAQGAYLKALFTRLHRHPTRRSARR